MVELDFMEISITGKVFRQRNFQRYNTLAFVAYFCGLLGFLAGCLFLSGAGNLNIFLEAYFGSKTSGTKEPLSGNQ